MRRDIRSFENIHAHRPAKPDGNTVLSVSPGEELEDGGFYSIGIHPWNTPASTGEIEAVENIASGDERIVAIGECGLDRLQGSSIEKQTEIFEAQIEIAERLGLPLIIHCVKAVDVLLQLRKRHPQGQWIFHGFRGSPSTAAQLLKAGIDLSFGKSYNEESYRITPPERRFHETD